MTDVLTIGAGVALGFLIVEVLDAVFFVFLYNRIKRWLDG